MFQRTKFFSHFVDLLYGHDLCFLAFHWDFLDIFNDDILLFLIRSLVLLHLGNLCFVSNHLLFHLLFSDQHVQVLAKGVVVGNHGILLEEDTKVAGTLIDELLFLFKFLDVRLQLSDEQLLLRLQVGFLLDFRLSVLRQEFLLNDIGCVADMHVFSVVVSTESAHSTNHSPTAMKLVIIGCLDWNS